jgi:pyruvate kinase
MVRKQTKIVATVANFRSDETFLRALYENGVNVVRLNTAHQEPEEALEVIGRVRKISDEIAVLIDTKGPEVRTGAMKEPLVLEAGDRVDILPADREYRGNNKTFRVSYLQFVEEIPPQAQILVNDGDVELRVEGKNSGVLECTAVNGGEIGSRKSVNTPGIPLDLPSLTEKDKAFVKLAKEENIDFIAHSFVRNVQDVLAVKNILEKNNDTTKIIAKIENQEGVTNLSEILDEAYGLMVARGDLAIEIPLWEVPVIQKWIIAECIYRAQPVITATQMLYTMINHPRPTRAEINDVANAVFDGSDAVMLSGETAFGRYPLESVKMMSQIIRSVEAKKPPYIKKRPTRWMNPVQRFLSQAAHEATERLPIRAIITMTQWGSTARLVSSYRPKVPIYTKCTRSHTKRLLALQYGTYPSYVEDAEQPSRLIYESMEELLEEGEMTEDDLVLIIGTDAKRSYAADLIEIKTIRNLIYEKRRQFDYTDIFKNG